MSATESSANSAELGKVHGDAPEEPSAELQSTESEKQPDTRGHEREATKDPEEEAAPIAPEPGTSSPQERDPPVLSSLSENLPENQDLPGIEVRPCLRDDDVVNPPTEVSNNESQTEPAGDAGPPISQVDVPGESEEETQIAKDDSVEIQRATSVSEREQNFQEKDENEVGDDPQPPEDSNQATALEANRGDSPLTEEGAKTLDNLEQEFEGESSNEASEKLKETKTEPDPKASSVKIEDKSEPHSLHHIKMIHFKDRKSGIITQNENGPCPLVAIINTLLLRRKITFPSANQPEIISAAKLMEYLGNAILENVPKNLGDREVQLNYEQNMNDAMAILPKLQTGLDVNVKFTGVCDFEYTPECIIFDLLDIRLYHGWLVDPQDAEIVSAIGQAGYNQLVEKVITNKCSNDPEKVTEALIIESFLERSASQLTYHGLVELTSSMSEGEVAVLFRNNHFSTIYKHQNQLFHLVTDQGFLNEPNVVWETLNCIDGDGQFVDGQFRAVPPKPEPSRRPVVPVGNLSTEQQIDQDFLVALSLQEEQPTGEVPVDLGPGLMTEEERAAQELRDAELARQLQDEEQREAAAENEREPLEHPPSETSTQRRSSSTQPRKKDNCVLL